MYTLYCEICDNYYTAKSEKVKYCSALCNFKSVKKVKNKDTECIEWAGNKNYKGYGRFKYNNVFYTAHRFICEIYHGPPGDKHALHSCDNPSCVNPDHLRWGTNMDNVIDKMSKNRHVSFKEENNGNCKLKKSQAYDIKYKETGTYTSIAKKYNISSTQVSHIKRNMSWKNL